MAQVKVGGLVDESVHRRLTSAAQKHKTSIGSMVAVGLQLLLDQLKDPAVANELTRDQRRKSTGTKNSKVQS